VFGLCQVRLYLWPGTVRDVVRLDRTTLSSVAVCWLISFRLVSSQYYLEAHLDKADDALDDGASSDGCEDCDVILFFWLQNLSELHCAGLWEPNTEGDCFPIGLCIVMTAELAPVCVVSSVCFRRCLGLADLTVLGQSLDPSTSRSW